MHDFLVAGGKSQVREFHESKEISQLPQKLVFNCTGLGVKALFHDEELTPVPEIEYSVIPGNLYMFSRRDGVVLGGTHDEGVWSLDVDNQMRDQIVAKHKAFFDSVRAC